MKERKGTETDVRAKNDKKKGLLNIDKLKRNRKLKVLEEWYGKRN